ncbi:MAG: RNA 2',3'-cyclic phosphodiesterase [Myxococcaceae bacterium]
MRTFIAIELEERLKARLEEALGRVRKLAPEARWVRPDSLHLTLAFLGEVADAAVPQLEAALARVAARHPPLSLEARGSGTFGPLDCPKVLWVGLSGDLSALAALQKDVAGELSALGHPPDFERFEAHVTLARSKHPRGDASLARCASALSEAAFGGQEVLEVVLFSSSTGRDGMYHQAIARQRLSR